MLIQFVVPALQLQLTVYGEVVVATAMVNVIPVRLQYLVRHGVALQQKAIKTNVLADTKSSAAMQATGRT